MATKPKEEKKQATNSTPVQKTDEDHVAAGPSAGLMETLENQYHKIKEHAETYPYVWGSYIVVYGGFGLWTAYRWRKLRKTEDRVRGLQARLKQLVEAQESSATSAMAEKAPSSSEKPAR
ncbi:uncharacterized protein LOC114753751 [Neltuma alba]|uniref:uncharacterized protein LOC114737227 n=1 Tax=Neltuma alba TaxID=207710 RepID=UPI0010A2C32A|nr:uncharacterized protein LOC114737227 [Prosopis alba]XP_028780977.1 uncharacterized protein LOC114737227 [Prosopis alba]XP_028780978.1 uncharacterized protein LOC114737227 [Prosopis alba]XP_028780979.1 uncharacterized protein LOC114737227 [Prosopis alba]XP_028798291.1 uncharacterized protein LOC114753751 [Prosopis alba]XP_028798292.1 uncharacterized protein LOC114753751 [Prosopis alba]